MRMLWCASSPLCPLLLICAQELLGSLSLLSPFSDRVTVSLRLVLPLTCPHKRCTLSVVMFGFVPWCLSELGSLCPPGRSIVGVVALVGLSIFGVVALQGAIAKYKASQVIAPSR